MPLKSSPLVKLASILFSLLFIVYSQFSSAKSNHNEGFTEIEWIELMPKDDLDALLNPPDMLLDIVDGSEQDSVDMFSEQSLSDPKAKRFQEALTSTRVIESFNNKAVRIPGFIVPIENTPDMKITEFFIVPYFGACLHMPPPPPNQIIHVEYKNGVALENLEDPFWFEGTIVLKTFANETGASAYSMELAQAFLYE